MDALTRLAHAARDGQHGAEDELIRASYAEVRRLCAALVDDQAADDLAQDAMLRVTRALRRYRGEADARIWILSIARRTCMDELRTRSRARRRDAALAHARTIAPGAQADHGSAIDLHDLVHALDPDRRAAFVLTQLLGLSYAEAAGVCDCPPGTIRSRVARARTQLVTALTHTKDAHTTPQRSPAPGLR